MLILCFALLLILRFLFQRLHITARKAGFLLFTLLGIFPLAGKTQTTPAAKKTTTQKKAEPSRAVVAQSSLPTKKDGTQDMRYKSNKEAAKHAPIHLKKNGTPDGRYIENKRKKKKLKAK